MHKNTGIRTSEYHQPVTLDSDALRPPLLSIPTGQNIDDASETDKKTGIEVQNELRDILRDAFTNYKDSVDPKIGKQSISPPGAELLVRKNVKIDPETRTISFRGHQFGLPAVLQINKETKTIGYTPRIFGASRAVVANAAKDLAAPKKTTVGTPYAPVLHPEAKPMTPAQQAAAARAAQTAQAAEAASQAAQQREQANNIINNSKKLGSSTASRGSPNKNIDNVKQPDTELKNPDSMANKIITEQKSMKQNINDARIVGDTIINKRQESTIAVQHSADQNVGNVVAATNASRDANSKNQQDRGQNAFQQAETEAGRRVVEPGKPGKLGN